MLEDEIKKSLEIMRSGGVILYPTDTIWGLGCDATNENAVQKLLEIKQRPVEKSFIILLDTVNKLQSYLTEIPEVAYELIGYAENPLTIVFSGAKNLAPSVVNANGTVGVRIVKHAFCSKLIERFRKPIVSTSANLSGQASPQFFSEISQEILKSVDYVVDFEREEMSPKKPSTIVKLGPTGQFEFIRK